MHWFHRSSSPKRGSSIPSNSPTYLQNSGGFLRCPAAEAWPLHAQLSARLLYAPDRAAIPSGRRKQQLRLQITAFPQPDWAYKLVTPESPDSITPASLKSSA
jgi:hypothetical protein